MSRKRKRHSVSVSEREAIEASRLDGQPPLTNAQLQTPEAWRWVWSQK